ncbi:hypothetical protein ERO13_D13G088675v2 [Gossypium hirsutum]|uniref:Uncharacterized protein n=1 Tax=Gossypium darwinii TaxID=34276 RepID=A0A5D1ZZ69_GOSDA|nr:hypothetical protein ERO13_D13G088675v2 [Gossypium hirsutum]TYG36976.1 hypothetical protein ES288_D13G105700v1 [Gossypium darwinii]
MEEISFLQDRLWHPKEEMEKLCTPPQHPPQKNFRPITKCHVSSQSYYRSKPDLLRKSLKKLKNLKKF